MLVRVPRRSGGEYHVVADMVTHLEVVGGGTDIWLRGLPNPIESSLPLEEFEDRLKAALGRGPLMIRKPVPEKES